MRRSCEPASLGWYLVHWGLDRGLSEEVGSEVEVTNTSLAFGQGGRGSLGHLFTSLVW